MATKPLVNGRRLTTPPHSMEAEQGLLGTILMYPEALKQLPARPTELFWDLRHKEIMMALQEMDGRGDLVNLVHLAEKLRNEKRMKAVGGLDYLSSLDDHATSPHNLPYYIRILREKQALRALLTVCTSSLERIHENNGADATRLLLGIQADLDTCSRIGIEEKKRRLKVWTCEDLEKHEPPMHHQLIGDNEICMGYEGLTLLAGPGSSGKSLAITNLIMASARGHGTWLGRRIHRKFKVLVLQAENGARRLKREIATWQRNHPEELTDLNDHVFISDPPEGGLPFHKADFRAWVREEVGRLLPDLVVLDPWSAVATDDSAKDVIDKLAEIRSCFVGGEDCPGLVIVAHTKKPRAEDVRKGRGLVNLIHGSIALPNTARCSYLLLPWSDDPEDDRVYFCCPKLNDGEMYPATVWHRRFGTWFTHDDKTNPKDYGRSDDDDRTSITEDHLLAAFEKTRELSKGDLVKKLVKASGAGESTAWRAIREGEGYLWPLLMRSPFGKLKLRDPQE